MTPEEYSLVCDLVLELEPLDAAARAAHLEGRDLSPTVREALDELLSAPELSPLDDENLGTAGRQLLQAAHDSGAVAPAVAAADARTSHPERIGSYSVLGVLGEGGMGIVYRARRDDSQEVAALKVLRPDVQASTSTTRFRREMRVLRELRHPGIAAFFDAGQASFDGGTGVEVTLPFLAMEYVEGAPPGQHAQRQALDDAERLELMARVCDALEHAHQQGVIHRDLKPANVVVQTRGADRVGQPKVLDFGLARFADADVRTVSETQPGLLMGTLPYMSPEQVEGDVDAIDARSDLYSLGVMTYELLSGQLPYAVRGRPIPVAARIITTHEPTRIGALVPTLSGSVEHVLAQALEKDKARRYASAGDFAADLRAAATGRSVMARAPGVSRRVRRWSVRHPAASAGLAVGAVALVVLLVLLLEALDSRAEAVAARGEALDAQAEALAQAERARQEAKTSERVVTLLTDMFRSEHPDEARGETLTVKEVLDEQAPLIAASLEDEPLVRARLMHTLGTVYYSLAQYDEAEAQIEAALAIRREHLPADHVEITESLGFASLLRMTRGRADDAIRLGVEVVERRRADEETSREDLVWAVVNLAQAYRRAQGLEEAEPLAREAVALMRDAPEPNPALRLHTQQNLADLLLALGRYAEAEALARETLDSQRRELGPTHTSSFLTATTLGQALIRLGRPEEAEAVFIEALEASRGSVGEDHELTLILWVELGRSFMNQGRVAEALAIVEAVAPVAEVRLRSGQETLVTLRQLQGAALSQAGRHAEAEETFVALLDELEALPYTDEQAVRLARNGLTIAYFHQGRFAEAEPLLEEVLASERSIQGDAHPDTLAVMSNLAIVYHENGRMADARALFEEHLRHCEAAEPDGIETNVSRWALSNHLRRTGLHAEALPWLRTRAKSLTEHAGPEHPDTRAALTDLADVLLALGHSAEAETHLRRALELSPADDPRRPARFRLLARIESAVADG